MGQAKQKAERTPNISILMPTRGRPTTFRRALNSLLQADGTLHPKVEIVIGFDEDDDTREAAIQAIIDLKIDPAQVVMILGPRPRSLGTLFGALAERSRGHWIMLMCDDFVIADRDWYDKTMEAVALLPNRCGVAFPRDELHPDFPIMPCVSRDTFLLLGYYIQPIFPYWFGDTWWDELGIITGLRQPIDFDVIYPDGKGKTGGLRDLKFWLDVFEETRPMRMGNALKMLEHAYGRSDRRMMKVLEEIEKRQQFCKQKVAHLHNPKLIAELEGNAAGSPPSAHYAEMKTEAEDLVRTLRKQKPRRLRVCVAVPSGDNWRAGTATDVTAMCMVATQQGIEIVILNVQTSMVSMARNNTVEWAKKQECDYLFWVDSDMRAPPDTLIRLLKREKDIVGATYNKRVPPHETLGKLKGDIPPDALIRGMEGLHEALLLPGGMMLVKMSVYEKIKWPWYYETYLWPGNDGLESFKNMMRAYFAERPSDEILNSIDGTAFGEWMRTNYIFGERGEKFTLFSEDHNFCRQARHAGEKIWCDIDLTYETVHLGTLEVTCKKAPAITGPAFAADGEV